VSRKPMTEEKVNQIYQLLESAGAEPRLKDSFIAQFTSNDPPSHWRFIGKLGLGGKFHYGCFAAPLYYVSCYPEDMDAYREVLIEHINIKLSELVN